MPEGHMIHRLARDHRQAHVGRRVRLASPQGRFADESVQLDNRKLLAVEPHGKHLFYRWHLAFVHVHLGLYGKFHSIKKPFPAPRPTVRLRLTAGDRGFDLVGPNRCELLGRDAVQKILARLGQDPLMNTADPELVWKRVSKSKAPMGKLLLDQSVFAGVGNIYRADSLFVSGVHPDRPGNQLTRSEFDLVWNFLVQAMNVGLRFNRIINATPQEIGKPRSRMNREERLLVYKQEFCTRCDADIRSWEQGGRRVYACERCQTY